jgi:hypothetical protein
MTMVATAWLRRALPLVLALATATRASGEERFVEVPSVDAVLTCAGPLRIERNAAEQTYRILLAGKVVGEGDGFSATIHDVYPDRDQARLVFIAVASGGTGCQLSYRLVDVAAGAGANVTEEFGNCNRVDTIRKEGDAWYFSLFGNVDSTHDTWVYRGGAISELKTPRR